MLDKFRSRRGARIEVSRAVAPTIAETDIGGAANAEAARQAGMQAIADKLDEVITVLQGT